MSRFERKGTGESELSSLGSRIVGLAELALLPVDRGYVDDAAELARPHPFDHWPAHVEQCIKIGLDDLVPMLPGHLVQGTVADDAGVIHQHLDRSERGLDRPDTRDASVEITGVPLVCRHTSSRSEYTGRGFVAGIGSRYLVTGFK
jgi:hypothetical protein